MPTVRRIPGPEDAPEPVEEQLELPVDLPAKPRRRRQGSPKRKNGNGAGLGFEATLWAAADKLRNNMDAAEYKHVVLGLIFLKYISDAFEEKYRALLAEQDQGADPEEPDEYQADNIFWVPKEARWSRIKDNAKDPEIGKKIDAAMIAIGNHNPALKRALPREFGRATTPRMGELIDLISTIGLGDKENRSKDILGRVYEYFLSQFASAEGKKGGQFYTPQCVVRLLVEMLAPYRACANRKPTPFTGGMRRAAAHRVSPLIAPTPPSGLLLPNTSNDSTIVRT